MPILQPLESMERISRQALADDLDTVLERISREDIGLVITEEGKDDLVLCPASWFNLDYVDDFSCVINSALRYAMRRLYWIAARTICRSPPSKMGARILTENSSPVLPFWDWRERPFRSARSIVCVQSCRAMKPATGATS